MIVAIIDYGSGNLRSVAKAFERVGDGADIQVTNSPKVVRDASHIVLPGVGAFADCMNGLMALPDMLETLQEKVLKKGAWFLGICVGMQMLFERGHEHGAHDGLGWLRGEVVGIGESGNRGIGEKKTPEPLIPRTSIFPFKIPHMGWNDLKITGDSALLKGIKTGDHAYFVHSYHAKCADPSDVIATVEYGETIAAAVARGNIMGTQFHPEKSQETGLKLLKNFLAL